MSTEKKLVVFSMYAAVVGVLTACGGGGGDSSPVVATPAETPAPTPSSPTSPPPPSTQTYSVGGSVSGLLGPVVLKNNGGDALQIASASTLYTFTTKLAQGAGYAVTADTQPGQNCSVSNSKGTIATANVVGANLACSSKVWLPSSQPLEKDDNPVVVFTAGMDDQGNVTALFVKSNGTRPVLYAVRGTPGAAGADPVWGTAIPLDAVGSEFNLPASFFSRNLSLAVSPGGNAHAVWIHAAACTKDTFNPNTGNTCKYIYGSRYIAASGKWDAPVLLGDTPSNTGTAGTETFIRPVARINDRGDAAIFYAGWTTPASSSGIRPAVAWRSASSQKFDTRRFDDLTSFSTVEQPFDLTLDNSGVMVVAGHQKQASSNNKDIVVYTGNLIAGFAATTKTVLDTRGADAQFIGVSAAPTGEVSAAWHQSNGTAETYYAAVRKSAAASWVVDELGAVGGSDKTSFMMTQSADALLYVNCGVYKWSAASAKWGALKALPSDCGWYQNASSGESSLLTGFATNGNYLSIQAGSGLWTTYDTGSNAMIHPALSTSATVPAAYVLGFDAKPNTYSLLGTADGLTLLASNGIGAYLAKADFDTLPTATQPKGDGRANVTNLWGFYLK